MPYHRHMSINSNISADTDNGSLYPSDRAIYQSLSMNSLWHQQMLIDECYTHNDAVLKGFNWNKWRALILKFVFVIIIGVSLALSCLALRFSTYAPNKLYLNDGDQLLVPISTYFNEEVYFITSEKFTDNIHLYLLPSVPDISPTIAQSAFSKSFQMGSWSYQYWGIHLLKGSSVKISICADLHLQFYLLVGKKKMTQWSQQILYSGYNYHSNIRPQQRCDNIKHFQTLILKVKNSDVYYLLFSSSVGWRFFTTVYVHIDFNRTYYDTSQKKYSCVLSDPACNARYVEASNDIVLLDTKPRLNNSLNIFETYTVKFSHKARISFYLKFYGYIYMTVILVTLVYAIWRVCMDCSTQKHYPVLLEQPIRKYAYSLKSQAGQLRDRDWLVVSEVESGTTSDTERIVEISEHDSKSLLESVESLPDERIGRQRVSSDLTGSLCSRQESWIDYYQQQNYDGDQQLMDSLLTNAGVSAI